MPTATRLRQLAVTHVENRLYSGAEAEVVGMTSTPRGTRVGLEVTVASGTDIPGFPLGLVIGFLAWFVALSIVPDPILALMVAGIGFIVGLAVGSSGAAKRYATVTIDDTGTVVMSNKDCSQADFAEMMDRPVSAAAARADATASARHEAEQDAIFKRRLREELYESVLPFYDRDDGSKNND